MSIDKLEAVSDLARALAHAESHLPGAQQYFVAPFDFRMFVQSWSDTSLGFGGIAGQAFTDGTVVVCWRLPGAEAVVYIGGRLAYSVHKDDPRRDSFWNTLKRDRPVMGAADWQSSCPHRVPKNSNVCDFCGRGQPVVNL